MNIWAWGSGNSAVHGLKIPVAKWNTQAVIGNRSQMLLGIFFAVQSPLSFLLPLIGLGDKGPPLQGPCLP